MSSKYVCIFLYLIDLEQTDFIYVLCVVPGNTHSPLIRHCVCSRGGVGEPLAISSHCLLKSLAYKNPSQSWFKWPHLGLYGYLSGTRHCTRYPSPHWLINSLSSANYFNVFCHVTLKNHIPGVIYSSISSYTSLEREKNTLSKKNISVIGNP